MEEVYKQLSVVLRLRKYFRTMLELEWNNIVCLVKTKEDAHDYQKPLTSITLQLLNGPS